MARQYQRQGLMFEAVSAIVEHLFRVESVDYIHSGYLDFNMQSQKLHKKLGFTYLTTQRFRREEGGEEFIPASNEPSSRACTDIWRMPRGSNTPQLRCDASLMPRQLAAGYLTGIENVLWRD